MPYYNYKCLDCENITEIQASWQQKDAGMSVECSQCKSKNTTHIFGNIAIAGQASVPTKPCGIPLDMAPACGGSCSCH